MEDSCWEADVPAIMSCQPAETDLYQQTVKDEDDVEESSGGQIPSLESSKPTTPMAMSAYPQFGYPYHHPVSPQPPQSAVSPGSTGGGPSPSPGSPCCEGGRPVLSADGGSTVCSCQYEHSSAVAAAAAASAAAAPRLALTTYPRPPPAVYPAHYPSTDQNPYPSIDSSAFYSPLSTPYGLKDSTGTTEMSPWAGSLQPSSGYYPYDPTLAAYGYGAGYDLAARRKNATRESTATLKAWLNEHKKNPYPTKGEKIMLAIITKMTLTQVSTWFANARRRLKKENKMTWEPKNKTDDDDETNLSDCDDKEKDDCEQEKDHRITKEPLLHVKAESRLVGGDEDEEDEDEERRGSNPHHHMLSSHHHMFKEEMGKDCQGVPVPASKPKIWSLADTAACKTPPPSAGWGYRAYYYPSEVQADTPPQTPPSMKLPYQAGGGGGYQASTAHQQAAAATAGYYPTGAGRPAEHHHHPSAGAPVPQQPEETAFKPFYKSPGQVSGGFVSPV